VSSSRLGPLCSVESREISSEDMNNGAEAKIQEGLVRLGRDHIDMIVTLRAASIIVRDGYRSTTLSESRSPLAKFSSRTRCHWHVHDSDSEHTVFASFMLSVRLSGLRRPSL
jgi:hypothetical protein